MRIGIAVGGDRVRVVALRRGKVSAAAEAELPETESPRDALDSLLTQAEIGGLGNPPAILVLGPSRAQVRRVAGLPATTDARILAGVIRGDTSRFFLRNGAPLLATGVRVVAPGEVWAAALDETVVREVEALCKARGLRLVAAAPAAVTLSRLLPDGHYRWDDGTAAEEFIVRSRVPETVRRIARAGEIDLPAPSALAALGSRAAQFADAYSAAVLPHREPLAYRLPRAAVPGWRVALAASVCTAVLAGSFVLPARRIHQAGRAAASELEFLEPQRRVALREAEELVDVSRALADVNAFAARRRSAVADLAELTRALPESVAILSLRVDSSGADVVVLAPRAGMALEPLERLQELGRPEIIGQVTREMIAGRQMERIALRLRRGNGGAQ